MSQADSADIYIYIFIFISTAGGEWLRSEQQPDDGGGSGVGDRYDVSPLGMV